jgi:hypothetical protein
MTTRARSSSRAAFSLAALLPAFLSLSLSILGTAALSGCKTGTPQTATGAILMTTLAAGAAATRRAYGECYVDCLPGTRCNRQSGLCEALPCRDRCGADEGCEETVTGLRCIPASQLQVRSTKGTAVQPASGDPAASGATAGDPKAQPSAPAAAVQAVRPKEERQPEPPPSSRAPAWIQQPISNPNTPQPSPQMDDPREPPPR